jgi:UDP:flavonoid glycosyltransferase YjiC (YdhE family)
VLVEASRQLAEEDAPRIAEAITTALARPTYRHQASRLAAEMAATPSVDEVLPALLADIISITR